METTKNKLTIHQLFWYFVLFSVIGLIVETTYGFITTGILESRKGLIWGPFCPVYGVGATLLIILLNQVNQKSYFKLFFYGVLIGSIVEYLLSYGLEAVFGTRFWDYSYTNNDINGRICITYSFFWGVLAVLLMKLIKPVLDKLIDQISLKIKTPIEVSLFIFLVIDALMSVWAIHTYEKRAISEYYKETVQYSDVSWMRKIEEEYFTNERMQKTFPNLRTQDREGNQVFVRDLLIK